MAADDLLSFVQALDAADEEAVGGDFGDGPQKRRGTKHLLQPTLTTAAKLALEDLDDEPTGARPRLPLDVPLAPALKRKVEQQVAYDATKKDVSKWAGTIRDNRSKESLQFPQNVAKAPERSVADSHFFSPQNDFERAYLDLVAKEQGAERGAFAKPLTDDHSLDAAFPLNMEALQLEAETAAAKSKQRSVSFFQDRKAAHQAKIKSKKYRRMLARDRQRALLKQQLDENTFDKLVKAQDPEERRKRREERALVRARERLTLKTRKANQWASDMLLNRKSNDPRSRQEILDRVRAKDVLRREMLGKDEEDEDDEDGEDDGDEDEDDSDNESLDDKDLRDVTGDVSENEEQAIGRRSFKPKDSKDNSSRDKPRDFVNQDLDTEDEVDEGDEATDRKEPPGRKHPMLEKFNKKVEKQASARCLFQQHIQQEMQVGEDFKRAKEAEVAEDAPRQEDLTLPGWGSWTGPSYRPVPNKPPKVTKSIPGVAMGKRKDARLKHVIITEKRMNVSHLESPAVPFPFANREQYERSLDMGGLGPEWNTQRSFLAKTARRVKMQAGAVIAPKRIKSTSSNI